MKTCGRKQCSMYDICHWGKDGEGVADIDFLRQAKKEVDKLRENPSPILQTLFNSLFKKNRGIIQFDFFHLSEPKDRKAIEFLLQIVQTLLGFEDVCYRLGEQIEEPKKVKPC